MKFLPPIIWLIVAINLFYLAIINEEEGIAMVAFFAAGIGSAQLFAALRTTFRQAAAIPEAREQRVPEVEHRLRLLESELAHVNAELDRVRDGQEFDRKLMASAATSGLPAGRTYEERIRP
jgi:hypothetical protein